MNAFKNVKQLTESELTVTQTNYDSGIAAFSRLNTDYRPGQVILLGSRPGVGRTMFLLFLFYNCWKSNGISQVFISNEEEESQVHRKLIATVTGIKLNDIGRKFGDPAFTYPSILKSEDNFILSRQTSWEELKLDILQLVKENGVKVVYLDKIQGLFSNEKFNNRDQELGYIIRDIKKIAVENQLLFFISSTLNRSVEQREGKRPHLSDIRESGALEEFCDTVFLLHRPEVYGITEDESGNSLMNVAELNIRKNRFGPTGNLHFTFNNQIPRFEEFKAFENHNFEEQFYKTTGVIPGQPF